MAKYHLPLGEKINLEWWRLLYDLEFEFEFEFEILGRKPVK